MNNRALVAMSGGVDSSAAAALMQQQGFVCAGITLKLYGPAAAEINDAAKAAEKLAIPHSVLDLSVDFRRDVIGRFIETYEAGGTPNPCVDCNRCIKFGRLVPMARELGMDVLVTGHYARIGQTPSGRLLLKKAADKKKDQSYVLYTLTQEQLSRIQFPLGNFTKDEVRNIAVTAGLLNAAKQDSQDICFVPDGDYGSFMESYTGKRYPEGDIIGPEGSVIGRHRGIVRYTLGQRRGLGVAANVPVYVTAKDMAANTVTLDTEAALFSKTLTARSINLIACAALERPLRCAAKTRYLQTEKPATAQQTGPDEITVSFDEPQRAVTPGQSVVLYDGDIVIGGGIIAATDKR